MYASEFGEEGTVQSLVDKGAEVNLQNKDGRTALMDASEKGHEGIVQLLLDRGAKINFQNKFGVTVLMCAVGGGNERIVSVLLDGSSKGVKARSSCPRREIRLSPGAAYCLRSLGGDLQKLERSALEPGWL